MKKILVSVFPFLSFFLMAATPAYAQLCPPGWTSLCVDPSKGYSAVGNIITILLIICVVVSLVFLVLGGIRWITSSGDQTKIASARSTIIASIVGLVIAILAYAIVSILVALFTGKGLGSMSIPTLVP